jgi:hypothetical protein
MDLDEHDAIFSLHNTSKHLVTTFEDVEQTVRKVLGFPIGHPSLLEDP